MQNPRLQWQGHLWLQEDNLNILLKGPTRQCDMPDLKPSGLLVMFSQSFLYILISYIENTLTPPAEPVLTTGGKFNKPCRNPLDSVLLVRNQSSQKFDFDFFF